MRCTKRLVVAPLLVTPLLLPLACGNGGGTSENFAMGGAVGAGGEVLQEHNEESRHGTIGASGASSEDEERSVFLTDEEPLSGPKQAPDDADEADCDPDAADTPDDDFEDSNCDGIDGDVERAVFVAPNGDDLGQGSLEDPLQTIGTAISLARAEEKDVYICNGTYDRGITVEHDAVNLYAGYDCASDWRRVPGRATVAPVSGAPLTLREVSTMTIERIVFEAQDADVPEASSVGGFIVDSHDIRLRRVEFVAKDAADGIDGVPGQPYASAAPAGADGTEGCNDLGCEDPGRGGANSSSYVCPGGEERAAGGRGGKGATHTMSLTAGEDADEPGGGRGGTGEGTHTTSTGLVLVDVDGEPGKQGRVGSIGLLSEQWIGHFRGEEYVPSNVGSAGMFGQNGAAGGGGSGGPHRYQGDLCCRAGHGGSQGGVGGCGGYPGEGGSAGGGSFGLVMVDSDASLSWVRIITGNGGRGGAGGAGGSGQPGGQAGEVHPYEEGVQWSGRGGVGGDGGRGGDGSPGGGGPSVALALVNSSLNLSDEVQVFLANPGAGGAGVSGADGRDGAVAEIYDFSLDEESSFSEEN